MQGIILQDHVLEEIEAVLDHLLSKIPSCSLVLADISGRLISERNVRGMFNPTNLAALTAGNMAATTEIANQIGEVQPFQLIFHEGENRNIYLSDVGGNFLLVVVFDGAVQIGVVRLFTQQAIKKLMDIAKKIPGDTVPAGAPMDDRFVDALSAELDEIFRRVE